MLAVFGVLNALSNAFAASVGGCDNYSPSANGSSVTCNSTITPPATAGVISPFGAGSTTVGNGINLTISSGTILDIFGSTVGLGSSASVTNNGVLNTGLSSNGYGISSGVNARSQLGGSTIINNGSITTNGGTSSGVVIYADSVNGAENNVTNTGSILTRGNGSNGILVRNAAAITQINNSGSISAAGTSSNGIQVTGATNITNTGIICPSGIASGTCISGGSGTGNGIQIDNNANTNRTTITNTGTGVIGAPTLSNYAIYSAQQPGVDINNYGRIFGASASATAINFAGLTSGGSNNSVTLYGGSSLLGGISFNKGSTQETLTFNGFTSNSFSNALTGLNIISAINSSNVVMNSAGGYELVSGRIAVDGTSGLEILGVVQNQTSPSAAASSIQKTGAGTLTLSGANTYSGGTSLNAGTIAVGNNTALGTGSLAMATGTTLQAASSVALANTVSTAGTATVDTNGNNLGLSGIISGAGALTKTGTGTLTLSGANTYSGGTTVSAGTLAVGNNAALGTGSLVMANNTTLQAASPVSLSNNIGATGAANIDTNGNSLVLSGVISGASDVNKYGAGTLTLSGANTYSGVTNINAGSVILNGSTTSNTNISAGAILQGNGVINGNVNNTGSIVPSFMGTQTNLTVNGSYVGAGGNFVSNVYAPVASSVADKLVVSGAVSGATAVTIIDKGGLGNRTSGAGIEVVSVSGSSTANAFALNQRVASGAFEYKLVKGDAAGAGNSWYLRTDNPQPAATESVPSTALATPAIGERIEVSVYPALPSLMQLYAQTAVDTLDQRRGDLNLVDPQGSTKKTADGWARIIGKTGASTPSNVSDGPKLNFNAYALQFGTDLYKDESGSRTYVGPYVTIGGANGNTSNQAGTISTGSINGMQAYSFGLYATHFAQNGLYVDALAQGSKYLNANASSVQGAQLKTQGSGFTGSLEGGGRWSVTEKLLISPQAQVVYDAIGMNNGSDAYGQINFTKSEMSRGRLGLLFGQKDVFSGTPIFAYIRASYWSVFNPGTTTSFQSLYGVNPISFQSQMASRWMTVDAEINARLTKDTNLFINLAVDNSLVGTYQAYSGRLGIQTRF